MNGGRLGPLASSGYTAFVDGAFLPRGNSISDATCVRDWKDKADICYPLPHSPG